MAASRVEFFDIASKRAVSWSPNTARTRMVLNYLGIPHTTTWLSYPDISPALGALGVPPLTSHPRGLSHTSPAIRHGSVIMQDSFPIALYLNRTFSKDGATSVFPGAGGLPLAQMVNHHVSTRVVPAALKLVVPKVALILDERGADYFRRTRTAWLGKDLTEMLKEDPEPQWRQLAQELKIFSDILTGPSGEGNKEGDRVFLLGAQPSYADFVLVSFFQWFKATDQRDWERLMTLGKDDCFLRLWTASERWLQALH